MKTSRATTSAVSVGLAWLAGCAGEQPRQPMTAAVAPMMAPVDLPGDASPAPPRGTSTHTVAADYQGALERAYREARELQDGKNADHIPALAKVDPKLFGIALTTVDGQSYQIGDAHTPFAVESISKVFTLARAVETVGADMVQTRIGVVAAGQPFNSVLAVEMIHESKRPASDNPFVNAGAIATVDMLGEASPEEKWNGILGTMNAFAARRLSVNEQIYRSEAATNAHNQGIAELLKSYNVIQGDPAQAVDVYSRQCSVSVTAQDLAVMGGTLAGGGRNPLTRQVVISPEAVRHVLAVMATANLYENGGDWLFRTGVPGKSGLGGGILAVVPGRFSVAAFSPPLDEAGNSVRAQRAIESVIKSLKANFLTAPAKAETQARVTGHTGVIYAFELN